MSSGFRFRKSFKIAPWLKINISKTGASVSLGPDDFHITTGSHGTYFYMDLPGAGAYYTKKLDTKNGKSDKPDEAEALEMGFWQRLTTPPGEIALVDALKALHANDLESAYRCAKDAAHLADGAFLAGFLALQKELYEQAIYYLNAALKLKDDLGKQFTAYEIHLSVDLPVAENVAAQIQPGERGALLALAEAYQHADMDELAIEVMQRLRQYDPEDVVVRLSLAEMLSERYPDAPQVQQQIVELAHDVHNVSPLHASLMYYRARALRKLNLLEGAKDTLTKALRRKKGYSPELLRALRYERAVIYEMTGKEKEAHKEYQKIYAEAPAYEDVAARLGL
jgi:tetratricopeptide (TPR) repeat protein